MIREAHIDCNEVILSPTERFQRILASSIMLIRGEIDNSSFEEECHQIVGAGGYVLYTVDKVVVSCLKHLHAAFTETLCNELLVPMNVYFDIGLLFSLCTTEGYSNH